MPNRDRVISRPRAEPTERLNARKAEEPRTCSTVSTADGVSADGSTVPGAGRGEREGASGAPGVSDESGESDRDAADGSADAGPAATLASSFSYADSRSIGVPCGTEAHR